MILSSQQISIIKGVAIILMVMAHAGCPDVLRKFIYLFHMPLFFMMSGYCFKGEYVFKKWKFLKKRIKGLYIPYVKWSLIFLCCHNLFYYLNIYNESYGFLGKISHLYSLKETLLRSATIITKMSGHDQLLGGFWFLRALLFGSIISLLVISYFKRIKTAIIVFACSLIILKYCSINVPFLGYPSIWGGYSF